MYFNVVLQMQNRVLREVVPFLLSYHIYITVLLCSQYAVCRSSLSPIFMTTTSSFLPIYIYTSKINATALGERSPTLQSCIAQFH